MNSLGALRLPVSAPGDRQPRWTTLAERMTETQTPGVAVAVIDDGDLEWADGWDVFGLLLEPIDATAYVSSPLDLKITFTKDGLELDGEPAPRVVSV
jgi:hypothetical protein